MAVTDHRKKIRLRVKGEAYETQNDCRRKTTGIAACAAVAAVRLHRHRPAEESSPAPSQTEEETRLVLPWSVPDGESAPSYEDYFSGRVDYGYDDAEIRGELLVQGTVVHTEAGDYQVVWEGGVLYLDTYPGGGQSGEHLGEIGQIASARVVLCDTRWIYLVADGTQLLRMDYRGEQRETLFSDESGQMDRLMGDRFVLADGKVMYLAAGTPEGGTGYYRLYLPEGRADLLYAYSREETEELCFSVYQGTQELPAECQISAPWPISNHEWEWSHERPEFYRLYSQLLEDPEMLARYFASAWDQDEIESHIESEHSMAHRTLHYGNTLTEEHRWLNATWTMLYGGDESVAWFVRYRERCGQDLLNVTG